MIISEEEVRYLNPRLKGIPPQEIIAWALGRANRPVVTTNFRPYAASLLHGVSCESDSIPVIWCDTGYNTAQTYRHALEVTDLLGLNLKVYVNMLIIKKNGLKNKKKSLNLGFLVV